MDNCGKTPEICGKLTMFIGEYKYTIDVKKRLALPSKFRKELGKTIIVTKSLESCLAVYPVKEWKVLSDKLSKLPISQMAARGFSRIMLAGAMAVSLDSLGRVLIPDYLKEYAGLEKNVVVCGLSNKLEIWDEKKWEEYRAKTEKEFGEIASKLGELGI